ncbi:MAG: Eco57I restriction-modification methylase domain-containing protein [Bacteroidales bacterium]|nr:Eco57I restriction-modification methylase domain-containing protein [Bacteroidales bacterium]
MMKLSHFKPSESLNKAYRKTSLRREQVEAFKTGLKRFFSRVNEKESEENLKNIVADFLKEVWYRNDYEINTKDRKDLVIHNGKSSADPVGVIIEVKRPGNRAEMISSEKPNAKALHEIILYYLKERLDNDNSQIKHLIVTNIWEWYIFDGVWFEKNIFRNKKLKDDYENYKISGQDTRFFYDEIAAKYLESLTEAVPCTLFNLKDYEEWAFNAIAEDDVKLLDLYKIFSPEHLLTKSFLNDSNTLNREFYAELLHIIGLGEVKEKSKKLIGRKPAGTREEGSILENTIHVLKSRNRLAFLSNPQKHGDTEEERLFSIGLELVITWLNRILFLKLLEGQLIAYHRGDKGYAFLNNAVIEDFDQLNELFFEVLAIPEEQRVDSVREKFGNLPYLNSSLFEESDLEREIITITELKDRLDLEIHHATVLKDTLGKRIAGRKNTLQYLFEFLDAYDFSSDSKEEIQEQNKTLISASVLGLIFEKINGYKDGSYFTPGFITMYMCRETIRRAVVQKFRETKGWAVEEFSDLYDKIGDKKEANGIVNSLKICDPAVGSGHFLVSALNEIIAIKSELKILLDRDGKTLRDYQVEVVNDELVVTDDDGRFFRYNPLNAESRRVQEALFHEKQTIIENCLFGVDINPKSVMICRLRLWIELLKNAYYINNHPLSDLERGQGVRLNAQRLETLPNLDINIKCGNSLISRFALDADLGEALRKSKWNIDSYRLAVQTYRGAQNKEEKRAMEKLIGDIKRDFETEVTRNDKRLLKLNRLKGELTRLTTQPSFFEMTKTEKAAWERQVKKLAGEITALEKTLEEIRSNKIYENAFEWRFEFPEVLDDNGKFTGFDVVIGNPPYISYYSRQAASLSQNFREYFLNNFEVVDNPNARYNSLHLFLEKCLIICKTNYYISLIIDKTFLNEKAYTSIRKHITESSIINELAPNLKQVFEGVVDPLVIRLEKKILENYSFYIVIDEHFDDSPLTRIQIDIDEVKKNMGLEIRFELITSKIDFNRIFSNTKKLKEIAVLKSGANIGGHENEFISSIQESPLYKPVLRGSKNIGKYFINDFHHEYILYDHSLQFKINEIEKNKREGQKRNLVKLGDGHLDNRYEKPKLIIRQSSTKFTATYDNDGYYCLYGLFIINQLDTSIDLKYLLALLNSKLYSYYGLISNTIISGHKKQPQIRAKGLKELPVKKIKEIDQGPFIKLVEQILNIKKSDPLTDTSALESEIDRLIYELYGLTEDEITIVEGNT